MSRLCCVHALRTLNLRRTNVSDAGLVHFSKLKSLRSLDLMHTQVSDAGLVHLSKLKVLRNLGLWRTKVSDDCPAMLPQLACHDH